LASYTEVMVSRVRPQWLRRKLRAIGLLILLAAAAVSTAGCSNQSWFHTGAPTLTVKAGENCPVSAGKARDVKNAAASSSRLLSASVPASKGLGCVYGGSLNPAPVHQIILNSVKASRLAAVLRQVSIQNPPDGPVNCPADTGGFTVIAFTFTEAPDEDVRWDDSGCQTLDNGRVGTTQIANDSFGRFQIVEADVTR